MANKKRAKGGAKRKSSKRGGAVKPATNTTPPSFPRPKLISSSTTAAKGSHLRTKQAHTTHACSILDPFCTHAKGARRPDGLGSQSLPYQSRSIINVATNASGSAKVLIGGLQGVYGSAVATLVTSNWNFPASWTVFPGSAFIQSNAKEVRLVSMGVRVMSTTSATNSQGFVILGTMNNPPIVPAPTGPIVQQATASVAYAEHSLRPLTSGFESVWISKPTGSDAHEFRNVTALLADTQDMNWTSLSVEVGQGPVSTNVLMLEVICNVEFTMSMDTASTAGLSQLVPPSKPANPVALQAQAQVHSRVSSIMDTTVEKAGKFIESKAGSVVDDILTGAMAFLGL